MTLENASKAEDYPRDVWAEATRRWNALPPAEKARQMDERRQQFNAFKGALAGEVRKHAFKDSFGVFDILWFGLATVTAFRIGSGTFSPD